MLSSSLAEFQLALLCSRPSAALTVATRLHPCVLVLTLSLVSVCLFRVCRLGARVQALLKDLRERPGSVEGLSALDVAEAARAIASAMPGGRAEGEQDGAGRGGRGPGGQAGRSGAARHRDGVPGECLPAARRACTWCAGLHSFCCEVGFMLTLCVCLNFCL